MREESKRLLYVALTRAKHTLVLAFDRQFFPTSKGQITTDSQIKWLRADAGESNYEAFAALAPETCPCAETSARQQMIPRTETRENFGRRETGWIDRARQSASHFVRTISPSKFAAKEEVSPVSDDDAWIEVEPELRPLRIDNPATRYFPRKNHKRDQQDRPFAVLGQAAVLVINRKTGGDVAST